MTDSTPLNSSDPMIGKTIGNYSISGILGRGGMATVYKAWQINMSREVALKMINPNNIGNSQFITRFEREIRTIAGLDHPHILPVFDSGTYENTIYLTMRLVGGDRWLIWCKSAKSKLNNFQARKSLLMSNRSVKPSIMLIKKGLFTAI